MSDQAITSLIEKLEGAEVGSRELDCAVARVLDCYKGFATEHLTTSLDTALALAGRVLPGWLWTAGTAASGRPYACIMDMAWPAPKRREHDAHASTPALALCAAILRAQSEARV